MKKKMLTLMLLGVLITSMVGCKAKAANSTGDSELDAQLAEINGYVQDIYAEEEAYEKERKESLASSKNNSLSLNNDTLEFTDVYLINKSDANLMVFGIKHYELFDEETTIYVYGINAGEEKLLIKDYPIYTERTGFGTTETVKASGYRTVQIPAIKKFDGVIETTQTCFVDWDGYESYRIDLVMEDGDLFEPKVLDTASYSIDAEDLIRTTQDEFIKIRVQEIMDKIEGNKCKNEQMTVECVGGEITSTGYNNITLSIENTTNLPISNYTIEMTIMDIYDNQSGLISERLTQLNPGESVDVVFNRETSVGLNVEDDTEYIVRIAIYDNKGESVMDSYVKSKF